MTEVAGTATRRRDATREPLYHSCDRVRERGALVVSAVHMAHGWSYPAVFDNVLSVQAGRFANAFDFLYRQDEAVECLAHGERDVRWLGNSRRQVYGSSFAAPHMSAIVALLLEHHPGADVEQIRELLARYAVTLGTEDATASQHHYLHRIPPQHG